MPSYISNSERRPVDSARSRVLLLGMILGLFGILCMETLFRTHDLKPDVKDGPGLWSVKRAQASSTNEEAIILLGASRIQLGIDVSKLELLTGRPVIQLAINGSLLLDVLEDLAADPKVRGDILVSASLYKLSHSKPGDICQRWLSHYHREFRGLVFPMVEQVLKTKLQSVSAIYSNLVPLDVLITRLWKGEDLPKINVRTRTNRDRDADYSEVEQPQFFIRRVLSTLGRELPESAFKTTETFARAVLDTSRKHIRPVSIEEEHYQRAEHAISELQKRGSRVAVVRFPTSGLVRVIEDAREPKEAWQKVMQQLQPSASLDFRDHKELQFRQADGSHLDQHQKVEFTERLFTLLPESFWLERSSPLQ